jgi:hypothetical protein
MAVEKLASDHGIERIGFLTLTFSEHVTDGKEAQKRWHSLRTHVLKPRYEKIIRVIERQKSGRIHYHLVVVLPDDIRTGADFEEFAKRRYGSANSALKSEWAFWRETAPRFGFGRTELLPVRSNAEGISKYVGKYISKHIGQREERDKGMRLVEYTRGARVGSTSFAWNTPRSALWRAKVASFAARHGCATYSEFLGLFGPRWAYNHEADILRADWSMMMPNAVFAEACGIPAEVCKEAAFPSRMGVTSSVDGIPWAREIPPGYVSPDIARATGATGTRHEPQRSEDNCSPPDALAAESGPKTSQKLKRDAARESMYQANVKARARWMSRQIDLGRVEERALNFV